MSELILDDAASKVKKQYDDGLQYLKQKGYTKEWPENERFKAGDQWPAPTEKTKHLPRPVFNLIDMVENHKIASVMNENVKMVYSTIEDDESLNSTADLFTRYSETVWENLKQDQLNEEALESAANTGLGIWHYFWNPSITGGNALTFQGDIEGEILDPINVFFGNPQQRRVQKQPYIIISSRDLVANVKQEALANGADPILVNEIRGDKETQDQGYDGAKIEVNDSDKVTVLTRYMKKQGQIFFTKVASGVTIKPETPTGRKLYPIAVMPWKRRKKSIHGLSETTALKPNQKSLNFLMAMQILSVQLTGWPKLIYKPGMVDQTRITNTPGEMIADNSPPGHKGVEYLMPGAISNMGQMLTEKIIDYTREFTGANDAATGQSPSSDLNASAIMLLQKAAGIPIESIKRRFYQAMEDIGRIWEDFFKTNYNTTRMVQIKDDNGAEQTTPFLGTEHADINMSLKIDIGPSSSYSETLMMSSLDKFLDKQLISFPQYLKYVPKNVVPFKDRLLKEIEAQQQQQMMQQQSVEQMLHSLPPEIQQQVMNAPPEQQQQMISQLMSQQQPPQGQPMPPQGPPMIG